MDDLDHRSLGARLDLWHIEEDPPGMVFWHPRGYALYRVLEDYICGHMRRLGYAEVKTPQLMPRTLWERSGHWEKFGDAIFAMAEAEERRREAEGRSVSLRELDGAQSSIPLDQIGEVLPARRSQVIY